MSLTIKIQKIVTVLLLLAAVPLNAQVLWTDNFNSYNTGTFTTGQGGWDVYSTASNTIQIIAESGKGNVLAWGWISFPTSGNSSYCFKDNLTALWNSRSAGNNVLKFEFDFWGKDFTNSPGQRFQTGVGLATPIVFLRCIVEASQSYIDCNSTYPTYNLKTPYNHTWIKVEVYIEYNANNNTSYFYTYIPSLNYLTVYEQSGNNMLGQDELRISNLISQPTQAFGGALIKYDNFKLSAIPTRPAHVSVNEYLSSKFNLYPNPATSVVNITNAENMLVNQVTVYDIAGKQLSTQTHNNETDIQLNVEHLASGTYMLHLQTNEGTAVKKLVKK